jgi:hypothetical protein
MVDDRLASQRRYIFLGKFHSGGVIIERDDLSCRVGVSDGRSDEADGTAAAAMSARWARLASRRVGPQRGEV